MRTHSDIDFERIFKIEALTRKLKFDTRKYGVTFGAYQEFPIPSIDEPLPKQTSSNSNICIYVAGEYVYRRSVQEGDYFLDGPWFDDLPEIINKIKEEIEINLQSTNTSEASKKSLYNTDTVLLQCLNDTYIKAKNNGIISPSVKCESNVETVCACVMNEAGDLLVWTTRLTIEAVEEYQTLTNPNWNMWKKIGCRVVQVKISTIDQF
jgi:hypothetical protein